MPDDTSPSVYLSSVLSRTEPFDKENSLSTKKIAAYMYIAGHTYRKEKEEEHMFVESEIENEDMTRDDKLGLYRPI